MADEQVSYTPRSAEIWAFGFGKDAFIDLFGDLIPSMTQDESARYVSADGVRACSALDFFKIGDRMYELRNSQGVTGKHIKSAQKFIMDSMRGSFPNLQTRIVYSPQDGDDEIIQNYGTNRAVSRKVNFLGADGRIKEVLSSEVSQALTGKTPERTAEILSYLNGSTPALIWRAYNTSRPQQRDERVVRLDADSGRCDLDCDWGRGDAIASFGVRARENLGVK